MDLLFALVPYHANLRHIYKLDLFYKCYFMKRILTQSDLIFVILISVKVNGFACKANFTADDFSFSGLAKPGATNNTYGSLVTGANVEKVPGLNTLGVSMSRIDYAPNGINPPHTHPRATEIIFVLEGTNFHFISFLFFPFFFELFCKLLHIQKKKNTLSEFELIVLGNPLNLGLAHILLL